MTWLIGASTFTLICLVVGLAFALWCGWSLFWHLYDTRMENSRRISNDDLNEHRITPRFTVGGDAK